MSLFDRLRGRQGKHGKEPEPTPLGLTREVGPPADATRNRAGDPVEAALKCPVCNVACAVERASFSQYVNLCRCRSGHYLAVQCGSCHQGVMKRVDDLDSTVHTKCQSCAWQSTGIPKNWWYQNIERHQQTGSIPQQAIPSPARKRQSSPTSCAFCDDTLKVVSNSPVGKLFSGVVCKSCGAVACITCQGTPPSKPCRECGGSVSPAYADELMKAATRFSQSPPSKQDLPVARAAVRPATATPMFSRSSTAPTTPEQAPSAEKRRPVILNADQLAAVKSLAARGATRI